MSLEGEKGASPTAYPRHTWSAIGTAAKVLWEAGAHASERPQKLADLTEVELRLEALDEGEHSHLRRAPGIPPTTVLVCDEDDLPFAPSILQAVAGAFPPVELPGRRQLLQQDGATHPYPQRL